MPKKSHRSVVLTTNTRHVVKFRKDPFRGVDGIDSKCRTDGRRHSMAIGGGQKRI